MKKFDWDAFGKEENKIAVWCKTNEEAIDFCNQSHEHGYDWCSGRKRNRFTYWEQYREETCYVKNEPTEREYYEVHGYIILEWSDYMATLKHTFTKSDLKDGDVILKRNGSVEIAIPSVGAFVCLDGYNLLTSLNDDLTSVCASEFDIVEVRRPTKPSDCIFDCFKYSGGDVVYNRERDTEVIEEMTLEEVCEALGKKIKIVEE